LAGGFTLFLFVFLVFVDEAIALGGLSSFIFGLLVKDLAPLTMSFSVSLEGVVGHVTQQWLCFGLRSPGPNKFQLLLVVVVVTTPAWARMDMGRDYGPAMLTRRN
jgi:hypothetical protein